MWGFRVSHSPNASVSSVFLLVLVTTLAIFNRANFLLSHLIFPYWDSVCVGLVEAQSYSLKPNDFLAILRTKSDAIKIEIHVIIVWVGGDAGCMAGY